MNKSLKDLLAKQYLEDGIDSIKKEAVCSLECIFDLMPMEQLCNQSRPMALAYLALTQEEPANEPLTLEQLREMDGEPVWVEFESLNALWGICTQGCITTGSGFKFAYGEYKAKYYRRKPEEVQSNG